MTTPNDLPSVGTEDYTEGRMTWRSRPDGSLIYIIGDPKVGAHAQGDIYINEADLRRISACWNACVGIADPENFVGRLLVLNEKTPKAESDLATIRSERDELASRVRGLEGERDAALRNRDMWKGQCERQAETLGMYHAKSTGLERDGLRYRYMRDLRIEQTGLPGQPCIAMPNGMQSGYYLTEETADHAVDTSITAQQKTSPESKP